MTAISPQPVSALVGVERDDRGVECGRADVAHRVVPAPERLQLPERANAGDLHRPSIERRPERRGEDQSTTTTSVPVAELALDLRRDVGAERAGRRSRGGGRRARRGGRRGRVRSAAIFSDALPAAQTYSAATPAASTRARAFAKIGSSSGGSTSGIISGLAREVAEALRPFGVERHVEDRDDDERVAGGLRLRDRTVEGATRRRRSRRTRSGSSRPCREHRSFGAVAASLRRNRAENERPLQRVPSPSWRRTRPG